MWNRHGYPASYVAAEVAIGRTGFAAAGLVPAKLVQSRSKTTTAAS